jgi:hypothetical protein
MFLWYPVMDLARAPRRTARKKGSGYENGVTPRNNVFLPCFPNVDKLGNKTVKLRQGRAGYHRDYK